MLVLKFVFVPRSTLFAYMIFIKNTEINESYKLCQVRDKHTFGGIVFYKHLFQVFLLFGYHSIYILSCLKIIGLFINKNWYRDTLIAFPEESHLPRPSKQLNSISLPYTF